MASPRPSSPRTTYDPFAQLPAARDKRPATLQLDDASPSTSWLAAPEQDSGPLTPSAIHPSYADPAVSASRPFVLPPVPYGYAADMSEEKDTLLDTPQPHFALNLSPAAQADPFSTRSYAAAKEAEQSMRSSPYVGSGSGGRSGATSPILHHTSRYSLGTHALLHTRGSFVDRLGARITKQFDSSTSWLVLYFSFNLGLTLFNKLVLQGFPFPWTLTGIQMLSGTVGTQIALSRGFFTQARLTTREGAVMIAFSVLYTINIAVSNLSLHLVTVPFHQVVRAMTPLFTIALSAAIFHKRYSKNTYLSLLPVIVGVVFATYGDYYFTTWGLVLTLFGTLLAALKTIVTNRIQVGRLKLHPLDLLIRMSPLAFVQCVFCAWYSGELERVRTYGATEMNGRKATALLMNGVIAFGLNVVSFTANKKTSPLTMTVAANVKQVLTIILAVVIFNLSLSRTNLFGITLTLGGGVWYSVIQLQGSAAPEPAAPSGESEKAAIS